MSRLKIAALKLKYSSLNMGGVNPIKPTDHKIFNREQGDGMYISIVKF